MPTYEFDVEHIKPMDNVGSVMHAIQATSVVTQVGSRDTLRLVIQTSAVPTQGQQDDIVEFLQGHFEMMGWQVLSVVQV